MLSVILFLIVSLVSFILMGIFRGIVLLLFLVFILIVFFTNKYGFLNFAGILLLLIAIVWLIEKSKNK
ncbi:hypothetical protein [Campylobacter aviculae]|uniref:Uncharacterized protein n=1 Tax=Campylobacter aviculae TaxID=2510190 RepID=A0A4U7BPL3_9BACT|nr:hypothetical protein [Campylobacter aviculae]TKX30866.1 hypothetical protein CQA76_07080 [Campylobacter aviculae]